MPRLAVFPKAFMHALCKEGTMKVAEWIKLASALPVEGLEWYAGFIEMEDEKKQILGTNALQLFPRFNSIYQ